MATPDNKLNDIFLPHGQLRPQLIDSSATHALNEAVRVARATHWDRLRSPHIFMGLLAKPDSGVRYWADRLGADLPELLEQFQELFSREKKGRIAPVMLHREFLSDNVIELLRDSYCRASDNGRSQIACLDLLIGILTAPRSFIAECFEHFGLTAAKLTEWAVRAEFQGASGET